MKIIFLDRRNIRKLSKIAAKMHENEEWQKLYRFIRHAPGHRNHLHVRIGDHPGPAGCNSNPDLEEDEDGLAAEELSTGEGTDVDQGF